MYALIDSTVHRLINATIISYFLIDPSVFKKFKFWQRGNYFSVGQWRVYGNKCRHFVWTIAIKISSFKRVRQNISLLIIWICCKFNIQILFLKQLPICKILSTPSTITIILHVYFCYRIQEEFSCYRLLATVDSNRLCKIIFANWLIDRLHLINLPKLYNQ